MNFKFKSKIQCFISRFPAEEKINFLFQRYITKSLPISDEEFVEKIRNTNAHFKKFEQYSRKKTNESNYYEFGAGYDLLIPILNSLNGFKRLECVDIRELANPFLLNDTIRRLIIHEEKINPTLDLNSIPVFKESDYKDVLKKYLNINYIAPGDARAINLPTDSIDYTLSNATMEHIPKNDLYQILKESFRILSPGGIMTNIIDYRDHFSFSDKSINIYNFLKYSKAEWDKMNPDIMYQNRLRHKDYMEMINEIGFEILEENVDLSSKDLFDINQVHPEFKDKYTEDELCISGSFLVLRKPIY